MIRRLSDQFFRWYCHPEFYPDIKGDLDELYNELKTRNSSWLEWRYAWDVLLLIRPSLIRPFFRNSNITGSAMLRNYFKISLRNLLKQKVFTTINVIGLAFGLTAFLMINQFVRYEESYDRHYNQAEQMYRLTSDQVVNGVIGTRDAMSFHPSGKALTEDIPGVINYTTTYKMSGLATRKGDQVLSEKKIVAADSNFFKLFDYPISSGNPETMLTEPYSFVLTESKVRSYFGNENPIGKTIYVLGRFNRPFQVTGVMPDIPGSTHYKFDMLMSLNTLSDRGDWGGWNGYNYYTYLLLDEKADINNIREQLPELSRKYLGEESTLTFNLQPVVDIHLYSNFTYEPEIHGSAKSVSFLAIISVFILVIAWVNYINLSTARSIDRAKEVGLRKVIGAQKRQLISQFLVESMMVNLLSAFIALGLSELLLPYFNQLIGKTIIEHVWMDAYFLTSLFIFFLIGTIVSGFYPALVLSSFKPVVVLRGKFRNSKGGTLLRKSLVVVQFGASLVLIASTFIVSRQVDHMLNRDMGIDIDYVVGFRNPSYNSDETEAMTERLKSFKQSLVSHHAVDNIGMSTSIPGGGSADIAANGGGVRIIGMTELVAGTTFMQWNDDTYMQTLDQELLIGRYFDSNRESDTATTIVNEAFLRKMGVSSPEEILNEEIQLGRDTENQRFKVIGVVRDFHRSTMKNNVEPTVHFVSDRPGNSVVKLSGENYRDGLKHLEYTWQQFFPDSPLEYEFIDQRFEHLYLEDIRFGKVFGTFSVLAIVVAILGLFGLSSFMAKQRSKEVGVRKVLGASTMGIVGIFYRDFLILILWSALFGVPLIYFSMDQWLSNYSVRIDFPWLLVIASIVVVSFMAFLTVGYQTYKVAIMNPSRTLRYE